MSHINEPRVVLRGVHARGMTRRQVLESAGAFLVAATNPACGLDPETIEQIINLIVQLSKLAFAIAEEVTGELEWANDGDTTQTIAAVLCLVRQGANGESIVDEVEAYFEVPPGESIIGFGELFGQESGSHIVDVLTPVGDWISDTFQIG